jgi:hypothetical protein
VRTLALGAEGSITVIGVGSGASEGDVELSLNATLEYDSAIR